MLIENLILRNIKIEVWPNQAFQLPKFQTHRGYHLGGAPENTFEAIYQARDKGSKMCEFDVQLSKDQIPILFHDKSLKRMAGVDININDLNLTEIESYFNITTLEHILTNMYGTQFYNIELKSYKFSEALARKVAEVVQKTKSQNRVIFSSFNPMALWMMQSYLPNTPRALLVSQELSGENRWYLKKMLFAPLLKIHMINFDQEMLNSDFLRKLNKWKIPFSVWTVNDLEKAKHFLNQGALSIISDSIVKQIS